MGWAKLLKRVFEIDMEHCPNCGAEPRVNAARLPGEAGPASFVIRCAQAGAGFSSSDNGAPLPSYFAPVLKGVQ